METSSTTNQPIRVWFTPKPLPCSWFGAVSRGVHRILLTPVLSRIRGSRASRVSRVKPKMSFGIQRSLKKRKNKKSEQMFSCNERKSLLQKSVRKSPWPKNTNTSMRICSETGWALCRPPWPRGPRAAVRTLHCHEPTVTQLQERLSKEEKHKSNCYLHHGSRKKKKKKVYPTVLNS